MNETITISTSDGSFAAYLARPATAHAAAVVVLQEIFGINADMRMTCDELAAHGFLAVCPDLFWRLEPGVELSDETDWDKALELYDAYDLNKGVIDVLATMRQMRTLAGASGKVGLMGFCLGGLMTFLTAARHAIDAAVAYHGGRTDEFLDEAPGVISPLLMHLAEEDEFISKKSQREIIAALKDKPNVTIHSYPGCSHAFARHKGTHYDAAAAHQAAVRTLNFLRSHLGVPNPVS
jgi:carboxymethylenebutenolidase